MNKVTVDIDREEGLAIVATETEKGESIKVQNIKRNSQVDPSIQKIFESWGF